MMRDEMVADQQSDAVVAERRRIAEVLRTILREYRFHHSGAVYKVGEFMDRLADGLAEADEE